MMSHAHTVLAAKSVVGCCKFECRWFPVDAGASIEQFVFVVEAAEASADLACMRRADHHDDYIITCIHAAALAEPHE